jgi:dCMP deaminase
MKKWDIRYMKLAQEVSTWSKDPSSQIGAVAIAPTGQVLSQGYNGFPRGISDQIERYTNREIKYDFIVHAEMNCIYNASFNGVSLKGSTIYVYGLPICNECAKGIIQVGASRVVTNTFNSEGDRWYHSCHKGEDILQEAGVEYYYLGDLQSE